MAGTPKRSITGCAQWWPVRIGDALVVEDGADVVRVDAVEHEREHRRLLARGADDAHARDASSSVACAYASSSCSWAAMRVEADAACT